MGKFIKDFRELKREHLIFALDFNYLSFKSLLEPRLGIVDDAIFGNVHPELNQLNSGHGVHFVR